MAEQRAGRRLLGAAALAVLGYRVVQRLRERSLAGQVVLLAGASRGLGLQLAHEFAAEGCRLAICGRDSESLEKARLRRTCLAGTWWAEEKKGAHRDTEAQG